MAEAHATETLAPENPTSETQIPSIDEPSVSSPAPDPGALEAEADDWAGDSAFGDGDLLSSTASIGSSILKYREENGRTYHAYKDGKYNLPNDEPELDRLDLQHHLFIRTLNGRLFDAPIPKEQSLQRVLDVGTGTGIWAIDFADEHPEARLFGIDLSPVQPLFVPPNVQFEIDDLEEPWNFPQPFDFIFARMMVGSFANFPRFFEQSFENLTPGGWIECMDICNPIKSDDGSLTTDNPLLQWSNLILDGFGKIGRIGNSSKFYKEQMEAAGFINVKQTIYKWPSNGWPKDKEFKELGMWVLENLEPGLEGLSMAIFTRVLQWSKEETEVFLAKVRKDFKDTKIHSYWEIYNVTGQKPPQDR